MKSITARRVGAAFIVVFGAFLNLVFINMSPGSSDDLRAKGLKEMTPEEAGKLHKIKVKKVRPNKLGLSRINEERQKRGLPHLPDSNQPELETEGGAGALGATAETTSGATGDIIPAQVDNSTLPAFPKVGNQGGQNSCVAWATTYYQMSHEVCLVLGCDNKSLNTKVYSPRWTYNMINSGLNNGSYFSDAFSVQTNHGASLLSELPYVASDYRGWDLNSQNWRRAISSRMSYAQTVPMNSDSAFANVKQLLLNGHVLVIGTYISSWQYRTVMANPNSASNPFLGQAIVTYVNGTAGGHAMTVVGYDDSIWTDINGNGAVESAEVGAFKIANSWGSSWKNAGYSWAAYDAFRSISAVPNFAPTGRRQLTQTGYSYLTTYTPYSPKLLALVTMSHAARSNISLKFGSSSTSSLTPQYYWTPRALVNTGGAYAFNGTTTEIQSSFYFDISSIASSVVSDRNYYLIATDSTSGNPLTVSAFQIIDPNVLNTLDAAADVPSLIDASTKNLIIGSYTIDSTPPSTSTGLTATLSTLKKGRKVTTSVVIKWNASSDNVGVTGYRVYRNGIKLTQTTSLSYSDASTSAGNTYIYEVTAIDAQGNESAKSVSVTISR